MSRQLPQLQPPLRRQGRATIPVFIDGRRVDMPGDTMFRDLAQLQDLRDTDLVLRENNGERRLVATVPGRIDAHKGPVQLEQVASPIRGAAAAHSGAVSTRSQRLALEAAVLRRSGHRLRWDASGARWVIFQGETLPAGFTPRRVDIAFNLPLDYPATVPQGAFLPEALRLNGRPVKHYFDAVYMRAATQQAAQESEFFGRGWRWLCIRPKFNRNPDPRRYGLDNVLGSTMLMLSQLKMEAK